MGFVHVSYQCGTGITPKLALDVSVGRDEMSRRAEAQRISGEESKFLAGARLNVVLVLRIAGITDAHDSPLYRPGSRRPPSVTANPSGYLRGLILLLSSSFNLVPFMNLFLFNLLRLAPHSSQPHFRVPLQLPPRTERVSFDLKIRMKPHVASDSTKVNIGIIGTNFAVSQQNQFILDIL
jgi:hypothetical protein